MSGYTPKPAVPGDGDLREALKRIRFDHTDSTEDGYNSLCDDDIDEIMALVASQTTKPSIPSSAGNDGELRQLEPEIEKLLEQYGIEPYGVRRIIPGGTRSMLPQEIVKLFASQAAAAQERAVTLARIEELKKCKTYYGVKATKHAIDLRIRKLEAQL